MSIVEVGNYEEKMTDVNTATLEACAFGKFTIYPRQCAEPIFTLERF